MHATIVHVCLAAVIARKEAGVVFDSLVSLMTGYSVTLAECTESAATTDSTLH